VFPAELFAVLPDTEEADTPLWVRPAKPLQKARDVFVHKRAGSALVGVGQRHEVTMRAGQGF